MADAVDHIARRLTATQVDALRRMATPGYYFTPAFNTGQALARLGLVDVRHYPHNHARCNGRKACLRNPGAEYGYTVTIVGLAVIAELDEVAGTAMTGDQERRSVR